MNYFPFPIWFLYRRKWMQTCCLRCWYLHSTYKPIGLSMRCDQQSVSDSIRQANSGLSREHLHSLQSIICCLNQQSFHPGSPSNTVSNINAVTVRWQGLQTDFWNVLCEVQSMWWTSIYTFSETEMSFFKVTGASVWEIVCLTHGSSPRERRKHGSVFSSIRFTEVEKRTVQFMISWNLYKFL